MSNTLINNQLALYIAFIAGTLNLNVNVMIDNKKEINLFLETYKSTKHLYPQTETFVATYNFIRETEFTVEQLEKYLLLV